MAKPKTTPYKHAACTGSALGLLNVKAVMTTLEGLRATYESEHAELREALCYSTHSGTPIEDILDMSDRLRASHYKLEALESLIHQVERTLVK